MPNEMSDVDKLSKGLVALGIMASDKSLADLLVYLNLLYKWNKVYNLTSIKDREEGITKHILDSATLVPVLRELALKVESANILDAGCGAGLPGIPTAILYPESQLTLVDTVGKKISFVRQAIITLKLGNATAINERVEKLESENKFDFIVSRAFSSIKTFVNLTDHLLAEKGYWIIMKGRFPAEELQEMPLGVELVEVKKVEVPFLKTNRHFVVMRRS